MESARSCPVIFSISSIMRREAASMASRSRALRKASRKFAASSGCRWENMRSQILKGNILVVASDRLPSNWSAETRTGTGETGSFCGVGCLPGFAACVLSAASTGRRGVSGDWPGWICSKTSRISRRAISWPSTVPCFRAVKTSGKAVAWSRCQSPCRPRCAPLFSWCAFPLRGRSCRWPPLVRVLRRR